MYNFTRSVKKLNSTKYPIIICPLVLISKTLKKMLHVGVLMPIIGYRNRLAISKNLSPISDNLRVLLELDSKKKIIKDKNLCPIHKHSQKGNK